MPELIRADITETWYYPIGQIVECGKHIGKVVAHENRHRRAVVEVIFSPTAEQREEAKRWVRSCLGLND